jgi:hypothetical protein
MIGTVEVKKPANGNSDRDKIFASNSNVAGQLYQQLLLTNIQLRVGTFGLVTTWNETQLVSMDKFDENIDLEIEESIEYFRKHSKSTDVSPTLCRYGPSLPCEVVRPCLVKRKKKGYKNRISKFLGAEKRKRIIYASEVFDASKLSKETIKVFATFIALSIKAYRLSCCNELVDRALPTTKLRNVPARCITVGRSNVTWGFTSVTSSSAIQWKSFPAKNTNTFYSIRQLGYGQFGCCCFALTSKLAPCVLKFYRKTNGGDITTIEGAANEEANNWNKLYEKFTFVKVFVSKQTVFLLMPYICIAHDKKTRQSMVKDEENSSLYCALSSMADKGYYHEDLKWHHIGQSLTECSDIKPELMFCDLASLRSFSTTSCTSKTEWVNDQFKKLKNRIAA